MKQNISTNFGEPLSLKSKKLVDDVRSRINQPLHSNFNTDFNIYRFVMNAERIYKDYKQIVENAAKTLNQHLKIRNCIKLDELPDTPFEENLIFKEKLLPCGKIQDATDKLNRLLWFMEYRTINVEGIAHVIKSSEAIKWQFIQFEHMLRCVNKQEAKTKKLSSLRHIIDMDNYEINPFTMLFVSSGTLSYYSQLFHYENYPELVNPIELVNNATWTHMLYKLIKTMMPTGFTDRFRLYDGNYLQQLLLEIDADKIPISLGGNNKEIQCIPAEKPKNYWKASDQQLVEMLEQVYIPPRKYRYFQILIEKEHQVLSWYFRSDGDFYFGIFYEPFFLNSKIDATKKVNKQCQQTKDLDLDNKESVYPWLKLSAKFVDESDAINCASSGIYYVVFSNKHCWLNSRTLNVLIMIKDLTNSVLTTKRCNFDGTYTQEKTPSSEYLPTLAKVCETATVWNSKLNLENNS